MSRGEGACNRAGEPSEPFFRGTGQGLYAPDLRPWRSQARRRRERVAVPTSTDDNNAWERQGRKDGAYPPLSHALGSRDGISEASAIFCRGRADGVRGDEATYLSMTVRHGHSRRARRPHATAPCLQQLRLTLPQKNCHGSVGAPTLPRSAALPPGPARCPRRACHWRRSATLCRQHPVLVCQHGMIGGC